jgi:hypothetical protein
VEIGFTGGAGYEGQTGSSAVGIGQRIWLRSFEQVPAGGGTLFYLNSIYFYANSTTATWEVVMGGVPDAAVTYKVKYYYI